MVVGLEMIVEIVRISMGTTKRDDITSTLSKFPKH